MRFPRSLNDSFLLFGARFPAVVVILTGVTLVASLSSAVAWRNGFVAASLVGLVPDHVWAGQAWRLITWCFVDWNALSLIFSILIVLLFGRDLASSWGGLRFLLFYLGMAVLTGIVVCLVGRFFWTDVWRGSYYSAWPLAEAITIAWATMYPTRQMLLYFMVPVGGERLIWVTVLGTVVFAFLHGFDVFLPHFVAMALTWAYLRGFSLEYYWLRFRVATGWTGRRRPTHLRPVDRQDRGEPPRWLH
jgi:membrane associated rhomboid family serine protease